MNSFVVLAAPLILFQASYATVFLPEADERSYIRNGFVKSKIKKRPTLFLRDCRGSTSNSKYRYLSLNFVFNHSSSFLPNGLILEHGNLSSSWPSTVLWPELIETWSWMLLKSCRFGSSIKHWIHFTFSPHLDFLFVLDILIGVARISFNIVEDNCEKDLFYFHVCSHLDFCLYGLLHLCLSGGYPLLITICQ